MPGSLEGVTVLDLTWGMAGPITTMVLADHDAEVIRIERPEPDPFVSPPYAVWNRNKLSVELDLADEAGAASFRDLVARADVLVESYRPGAMRALGFAYEQVRKYRARLVYCSVSGYGQRDRARDRPGYDALVAARFGLMGDQRGYRDGPIFLGYPVASYGATLLAVIGVTSTLLAAGIERARATRRHVARRRHAREHPDVLALVGDTDATVAPECDSSLRHGRVRVLRP